MVVKSILLCKHITIICAIQGLVLNEYSGIRVDADEIG